MMLIWAHYLCTQGVSKTFQIPFVTELKNGVIWYTKSRFYHWVSMKQVDADHFIASTLVFTTPGYSA